MTTTNTAKTSNRPTHELFFVEERPLDGQLAAALGRKHADNATQTVWHKAGVGFTSVRGNINVYVGQRGEPGAKRYFITFGKFQESGENRRLPVADIFEPDSSGNIDFKSDKVGVVFVNADDSFTLVIGDRGDLEQLRYQLRPTRPAPRATQAQKTAGGESAGSDEAALRMEALRREDAAAAAEALEPEVTLRAPVSRTIRRVPAAA